jgi:uncharacterized LabA/DUF88 family protein
MQTQERVTVFLDYANINRSFEQFTNQMNYADLLDYLGEGRFTVEAHAYVPIDPRNPHVRDHEIDALWQAGYLVHQKVGSPIGTDGYKCDFDVEITMELMRTAEIVRPDIIVLASGDKDFVPVVLELRHRGIRVEVAAFGGINAAQEMMQKASGFIDLCQYANNPYDTNQFIDEEEAAAAAFFKFTDQKEIDDQQAGTPTSPNQTWPQTTVVLDTSGE